jgi:hypothetical protein
MDTPIAIGSNSAPEIQESLKPTTLPGSMSRAKMALLMFKGAVSEAKPEDITRITEISDLLQAIVKENGDLGKHAAVLFILEHAVQQEKEHGLQLG